MREEEEVKNVLLMMVQEESWFIRLMLVLPLAKLPVDLIASVSETSLPFAFLRGDEREWISQLVGWGVCLKEVLCMPRRGG